MNMEGHYSFFHTTRNQAEPCRGGYAMEVVTFKSKNDKLSYQAKAEVDGSINVGLFKKWNSEFELWGGML